jgi:hypothetical protein
VDRHVFSEVHWSSCDHCFSFTPVQSFAVPIKKLKPPGKVAALQGAGSRDASGFREYIVAYPVMPGLQACLIRRSKAPHVTIVNVEDALVVLPRSVPESKGFPDPELAGYLAIAEEYYKRAIKSAAPEMKVWATRDWKSAPFSIKAPQGGSHWEPCIIKVGEAKKHKLRKEDWLIASRWADWEIRGLQKGDRFDEYCWYQGKTPPPLKSKEREKAIQRFRGKCRTLNLPKWDRE